jgi:hypothetical protein
MTSRSEEAQFNAPSLKRSRAGRFLRSIEAILVLESLQVRLLGRQLTRLPRGKIDPLVLVC